MFATKEYKGNALALTDTQISTDWRLGIVRGMARMVRNSGHSVQDRRDFTTSEGSEMTAHVHGNFRNPGKCAIVEVFEVEETEETEYVRDSGGDYPERNTVIRGKVTCKCGQITKQDFKTMSYSGLLKSVANAT